MKIKDMEIKDVFRFLFRLVGLIGLLYTCRHIYLMIHKTGSWHLGWLITSWAKHGETDMHELRAFVFEVLLIIFGFYLLRGCPLLLKLLFPEKNENASDKDTEPKHSIRRPEN